jgi:hypothetical protein
MTYRIPAIMAVLICVACSSTAFAKPWTYEGQYPLPPSLDNRTAAPECGFAATESWGPNGFQYCDSKNVYPRPEVNRYYRR